MFGSFEPRFWETLAKHLPAPVPCLWTGPAIVPARVSLDHARKAAQQLRHPLILWDNYPVNDSARASRHLYLAPADRPAWLCRYTAGLIANPMNQANLSRPALAGLAAALAGRPLDAAAAIAQCFPPPLADLLVRDRSLFEQGGLDGVDADLQVSLLAEYRVVDHPAAREVCDWLQGAWAFDPACLTE